MGNDFRMFVSYKNEYEIRDIDSIIDDFSIGLGVVNPLTSRTFMLLRYDGITSNHYNKIERTSISGFHIHRATERYQRRGMNACSFAVETDQYSNINEAFKCIVFDANIAICNNNQQLQLFDSLSDWSIFDASR